MKLLPLLLLATLRAAGGDGQTAPAPSDALQTARVQAMVGSAHKFLLKHQNRDGSFSVVRNDASKAAPVAVTALAAMSLMAAGHLPDRGPNAQAVERAIDWLVQHSNQDGYVTTDGDLVSRMHGQGYAVLAMTQAYGMQAGDAAHREELRAAIERGVDVIQSSQGQTIHGWWYDPRPSRDHEGSVTVCMIQALRAARDIGFKVRKQVIDDALGYMKASQDPVSGRFRYRINEPKMSWSLTAAALSTLNSAGDYSSDMLQQGFDALQRWDPYIGQPEDENWIEYGAFYAAQAYWQHGDGRAFARWWPRFVQACEDEQGSEGSWNGGEFGTVYGTAIVSLSLQVPLGYLPIFQR